MRRKGLLTLIIAVFSVVAFAGMAFAAQNIFLKTTVPDIPKSLCYQAGTQTFELDNLTNLANGDVIQFSLQNGATLCKSFNYFLTLHDGVGNASALLAASTGADPVSSTVPADDTLIVNNLYADTEFGLHVVGASGSQTYSMTVKARNTSTGVLSTANALAFQLQFQGDEPSNKLIIKFFDEKFGAPYFWKNDPATVAADYLINTVSADNALCVNTFNYLNEYLDSTPNSVPNLGATVAGQPLVFSGDYTIAHIVAQQGYEVVSCKDAVVGHIAIGSITGQAGTNSCTAFDFETAPNGYCTDHNDLNRFIVHALAGSFVNDLYTVKMEILVDRKDGAGFLGGDRGVYFSDVEPTFGNSAGKTGACADPGDNDVGDWEGFLSDGDDADLVAPGTDCTIADDNRAVVLQTEDPVDLGFAAGQGYLQINLPPFIYNLSSIQAGYEVKVKVTLTQDPCGTVGPFEINVGIFGCGLTPIQGSSCLFPYFTSLAAGEPFWNGIAVVNTGATAGTVTLTANKQTGGTSTYTTPSIAAGSMFVSTVHGIPWVGSTPAGVPVFIQATSSTIPAGSLSGFGFMSDDGVSSMGYLPVCQ